MSLPMLCHSVPTTYRGYDKRGAIRGAIPENWQIYDDIVRRDLTRYERLCPSNLLSRVQTIILLNFFR